LGRAVQEVAMACFTVLSKHLNWGSEENHCLDYAFMNTVQVVVIAYSKFKCTPVMLSNFVFVADSKQPKVAAFPLSAGGRGHVVNLQK
jgi:hypothetical protein